MEEFFKGVQSRMLNCTCPKGILGTVMFLYTEFTGVQVSCYSPSAHQMSSDFFLLVPIIQPLDPPENNTRIIAFRVCSIQKLPCSCCCLCRNVSFKKHFQLGCPVSHSQSPNPTRPPIHLFEFLSVPLHFHWSISTNALADHQPCYSVPGFVPVCLPVFDLLPVSCTLTFACSFLLRPPGVCVPACPSPHLLVSLCCHRYISLLKILRCTWLPVCVCILILPCLCSTPTVTRFEENVNNPVETYASFCKVKHKVQPLTLP